MNKFGIFFNHYTALLIDNQSYSLVSSTETPLVHIFYMFLKTFSKVKLIIKRISKVIIYFQSLSCHVVEINILNLPQLISWSLGSGRTNNWSSGLCCHSASVPISWKEKATDQLVLLGNCSRAFSVRYIQPTYCTRSFASGFAYYTFCTIDICTSLLKILTKKQRLLQKQALALFFNESFSG